MKLRWLAISHFIICPEWYISIYFRKQSLNVSGAKMALNSIQSVLLKIYDINELQV